MNQIINVSEHWNDPRNGDPAGGITQGVGFTIAWQNGPLGRCTCSSGRVHGITLTGHEPHCERREPNGAFVENIIYAAQDRLEYYQQSPFASKYNEKAIEALNLALLALMARTAEREERGVEGTHVP